ncbi:DUF397 domain-containing protein [Streptomyces sp. NPDC002523]
MISYSGGSGSACVEVGFSGPLTSVRDSKDLRRGTLAAPTDAFATFVDSLKERVDIRKTR